MKHLDHLVYATPDLDATVDALAARLGVRAAPGGRHPGLGTRNALLALGPTAYLEVIGPDPEQPAPGPKRWFGIDSLTSPRLVTWAVRDTALEAQASQAASAGFPLGPVEAGRRELPGGGLLAWRFTHPRVLSAGGVVPFFIEWSPGRHPAELAPPGLRLVELRAEHPEPDRVRALLRQFDLDLPVERADAPRLFAVLDSPRGSVELS